MINESLLIKQRLITDLQSRGLQLGEYQAGVSARKGGAGPSDHKAVTIDGTTVMVPVLTGLASRSPYHVSGEELEATLIQADQPIGSVSFPNPPRFYQLSTADGLPYWKIALLHSRDVLATTVQQTCIRYTDPSSACQFCAIGQSLDSERTLVRKTPAQLAEVAEAAVRLDQVQQMVMTTGTPNTPDRGAAYLAECTKAVKARVDLPIQVQCEPPEDYAWFEYLQSAGVDSLGMHLEAVTPEVRAQVMPGKASVSVETYFKAFEAAIEVFGWGQVSTYILAGLGDSTGSILQVCERLVQIGVYPFVVPFVPISGTPLAHHPAPDSDFMFELYQGVGQLLNQSGIRSADVKAGCAKCGACSGLSTFESIS